MISMRTGWEFECWLVRFFERLGFEVARTRYRGDYGADVLPVGAIEDYLGLRQRELKPVRTVIERKPH
jgi:Restriction endonuclease